MSAVSTKQPKSSLSIGETRYKEYRRLVKMMTIADAFAWGYAIGVKDEGMRIFEGMAKQNRRASDKHT